MTFLSDPVFGIPEPRLRFIRKLASETTAIYTNKSLAELIVYAEAAAGEVVAEIKTVSLAQTIDIPPVWRSGQWHPVRPVIIFAGENGRIPVWTVVHELCHLLSIGIYHETPNGLWEHHMGIGTFLYQVKNEQMQLCRKEFHEAANELLTDYVTWIIVDILFGVQMPLYDGLHTIERITNMHGDSYRQQLLGWYFSGNQQQLKNWFVYDYGGIALKNEAEGAAYL